MNGNEILEIKVNIAGRKFPLNVPQQEEGRVRDAAKLITETFEKYREKFPNEDYANVLAKSSLTVLVTQSYADHSQNTSELMDVLFRLEEELEGFVQQELA